MSSCCSLQPESGRTNTTVDRRKSSFRRQCPIHKTCQREPRCFYGGRFGEGLGLLCPPVGCATGYDDRFLTHAHIMCSYSCGGVGMCRVLGQNRRLDGVVVDDFWLTNTAVICTVCNLQPNDLVHVSYHNKVSTLSHYITLFIVIVILQACDFITMSPNHYHQQNAVVEVRLVSAHDSTMCSIICV